MPTSRFVHPLVAFAVIQVAGIASLANGQESRRPQDPPAPERPPYRVIDVRPDGAPESVGTATPRSDSITKEKFEAPKAQLFWLVMRGWIDDLRSRGPLPMTIVVLLLLVFFQGLPMFLAWDFARGAGRRTWIWLVLAAIGSWAVLPVMWIASVVDLQLRRRRSVRQRVASR